MPELNDYAKDQQVISTIEPQHDITRLFDAVGLWHALVCRACGCLVSIDHRMLILHADKETNYRWRIELPDYARKEAM